MISALLLATLSGIGFAPGVRTQPSRLSSQSAVLLPYLDMPLNVPGAYASGTGLDTRGGTVTCTRNSTAYFANASGLLELAAINTCRVESTGLLVEAARTNYILQSAALDTWTAASGGTSDPGVPTVSANTTDVTDPTGANTAEKIVLPAVSGDQYSVIRTTVTGTAVSWAKSIYLRTATGSATVYLNSTGGSGQSLACSVTSAWSRCTGATTLTAATWTLEIGVNMGVTGNQAQDSQTIYAWGAQWEIGAFATSHIPTAGTAVQRVADVTSIPWPARATVSGLWSISADVTPISTWSRTAYVFGPQTATNSVFVLPTAGHVYFQINDGSGGQRYIDYAASPAAGRHKLTACYTKSSTPELYLDGVRVGSATGGGTGILTTMPANLVLGANAGAGSELSGNIRNVRVTAGCKP